jgi:hypothetical protein
MGLYKIEEGKSRHSFFRISDGYEKEGREYTALEIFL